MQREDNHITWQEFKEIAGQHKIVDQPNLQNLAEGLHNCGSIVWFNQKGLRDLIVLKPQWLADLVVNFTAKIQYLVDGMFVSVVVSSNGLLGIIDRSTLTKKLLDNYPQRVRDILISILVKFEIIYPLNGVSIY